MDVSEARERIQKCVSQRLAISQRLTSAVDTIAGHLTEIEGIVTSGLNEPSLNDVESEADFAMLELADIEWAVEKLSEISKTESQLRSFVENAEKSAFQSAISAFQSIQPASEVKGSPKIPAKHRSRAVGKKDAAKLLGFGKSGRNIERLKKAISEGIYTVENENKNLFIFDMREIPDRVQSEFSPTNGQS